MGFKEFIKPNWIKIIILFSIFLPPTLVIYTILVQIFIFIGIFTSIIFPSANSFFLIYIIPLIIDILIIYLIACGFETVYRKTNNKKFLYILISIGIFLSILSLILLTSITLIFGS